LLGQSDAAARLLPALFGAAIVPLVYALHRLGYLDRRQALVAALFIAISPNLVYFSRFLRHDIFQLFFTVLLLVALLAYLERGKIGYALLAGLAAGGGMCLKEDMPLFIVIVIVFWIYLLLRRDVPFPRTWMRDTVIATAIAVGVMALFYSSLGANPEILETGVTAAYTHWTAMHHQCRICGPWFFYILLFLLYEVPIFILALFALVQFAYRHDPIPGWIAQIRTRFHRGGQLSEMEYTPEPVLPAYRARSPWDKKELFFLFCVLWFVATLAAYAYIGEKVPWLIIHQLFPAILVSVYKLNEKRQSWPSLGAHSSSS